MIRLQADSHWEATRGSRVAAAQTHERVNKHARCKPSYTGAEYKDFFNPTNRVTLGLVLGRSIFIAKSWTCINARYAQNLKSYLCYLVSFYHIKLFRMYVDK